VTALVTASAVPSWAPPLRLDQDAAIDRAVRLAAALLLWLGLLLVSYWWVVDGGITDLAHLASGLTSVGRLTGLWAADLLLIQVLLMSRLPPLDADIDMVSGATVTSEGYVQSLQAALDEAGI
jgi:FMN-binding domain